MTQNYRGTQTTTEVRLQRAPRFIKEDAGPREVPRATGLGSSGLPAPPQAPPHAGAGVPALTLAAQLAPGRTVVSQDGWSLCHEPDVVLNALHGLLGPQNSPVRKPAGPIVWIETEQLT